MPFVHKDIAAGIALVILAVAYWLGAGHIPKSLLEGGVGAEALPKLLGALLLVLSAILILQTALAGRRPKPAAETADDDDEAADAPQVSKFHRHKRAIGLLLIGVGYVLLVEYIGYAPAIAYLLGAVLWFAGGASRRTIVVFALIGAVFFWLLFVETLGIRQPKGFWPKLWQQIVHVEQSSATQPIAVKPSGTATL